MDARIIKWQQLAKEHANSISALDVMREESKQQEEAKRHVERINQFLSKIPLRFRGKKFTDYHVHSVDQLRVKALIQRYIETFTERLAEGSSLTFIGKSGTGKTLLSLIIYQSLITSGYSVKYEPSLAFLGALLAVKFQSQSTFHAQLAALRNIQLLIIDEATESINKSGQPSEIEKQLLFTVINERYENNLCTLIITNRDDTELVKRLGNPIVDRLAEKGITLAFSWNSYRQQKEAIC